MKYFIPSPTHSATDSFSEILSAGLEPAFGDSVCVFTRTLGPKTEEIARSWRKLNNDELQDLYF